jgi:hypothetical protein
LWTLLPDRAGSREQDCDSDGSRLRLDSLPKERPVCDACEVDTIVLSGGVFQNELLLEDFRSLMAAEPLRIWTNGAVPPNDGGISLGQAALAAFGRFDQGP